MLRTVGTLNGQQVSDVSFGYDSVGELVSKSFHHDGGHFHEQVSRNLQQWVVEKNSPVFILSLDYHTSTLPGSTPQYGGRISAQRWEHREADDATVSTGGYSYSYDSLGRLTGAGYHDWGSAGWSHPSDQWTEKGLTYTDNGDILTLKRFASSSTTPHDDLSFIYTGARRDGLQYDADGNVASDEVRGFTMSYNFLNLPSKIWVSEDDYMSYTWYYDGTKVSVEGYEGSYGADYIGSFVYNNDDDGFIRDIRFGDGIVRETSNGVYETLYWVTDHLGSPRVAFTLDDSEYGVYVAERNDYYPFGGRWDDGSGQGGTIAAGANRYALSGKERQRMSRMGSYQAAHESLLDFGARFYDPATAIFLQQDPLAEKYYNISPYVYCANNPVNFVDPDGLVPRLYIQKTDLGHAFVTTGEGKNTVVYSYGRYGALSGISGITSGSITPIGEGVLWRKTGDSAAEYLQEVLEEGNLEIYQINEANDAEVATYYDDKFNKGSSPTDEGKSSFNNPAARVIDTYFLLGNNCVTTSLDGINASSELIDTGVIAPKKLAEFMDNYSKENNNIIKISNPQEFITNLLKILNNEKQEK